MMSLRIGPEVEGHFQELLYEHLVELKRRGVRVFTANCNDGDSLFEFSTTNANLALTISNLENHGRISLANVLEESFDRIRDDNQRLVFVRLPNDPKGDFAILVTRAKDCPDDTPIIIFHCEPVRS